MTATLPAHDWANVSFNYAPDPGQSTSDDSFTPGQKQDTTCPSVSGHKNSPKDDFTDIATYTETASNGDVYLYGATIRFAANGTASENVELNQGLNGFCPGGSEFPARVDGDKLITIDYTNGGANVAFGLATWTTTGSCFVSSDSAPCWTAPVPLTANVEGLASPAAITAANNPISGVALAAGQFAEFGINLSATGIIPANTCTTFNTTDFESRASGSSFVSSTKDVTVINKPISNCGEVVIIKHTDPRGVSQNFSYTSTLAGSEMTCTADTTPAAFTLNDSAGVDNTTNTEDCLKVPAGSYTVTEGSDPSGFGLEGLSCTATTGSSGTQDGTNDHQANITLLADGKVTCTYVNQQLKGALLINKNSAKTGNAVLNAGAQFCYATTSDCTSTSTGTHTVTDTTDSTGNDSDTAKGRVCVTGVAVGTYLVNETSPPTGYAGPPATEKNQSKTVVAGSTCATAGTGATATFDDPPLADVQIRWKDDGSNELSLDGTPATGLTCTTTATTGTQDRTDTTGWKNTLNVPNIQVTSGSTPNVTLTCTVKIDP